MSAEEFIRGCNERGSESVRYKEIAAGCNPVPPFTRQGLAHLASLLSDKNTASGGVQRNHLTPDKSKRWAMSFLSHFNPQGYCEIRSDFVQKFAYQVVAGLSSFEIQLSNISSAIKQVH